jgi:hypothetical protein
VLLRNPAVPPSPCLCTPKHYDTTLLVVMP